VCWLLTLVFALISAGLIYTFMIRGETVPASDGRTAILLAPGERDLILSEMRGFLGAIQAVTQAGVDRDVSKAVAAARQVGMANQQEVPAGLIAKLPLAFKKLGFDTHSRFDQLALNAEQLEDAGAVLPELAELMQNCIACHAAYRIDPEPQ
jgi:hypothetical protein